jgi:membrane-bound lytic murein transglycosylase MltF
VKIVAKHLKEEQELAQIQEFIERLPPENADLLVTRGSGSRQRRDKPTTAKTRQQIIAEAGQNRARKFENIEALWLIINELQEQERLRQATA